MLVEGRGFQASPAGISAAGSPASVQNRRISGSTAASRPARPRAARVAAVPDGNKINEMSLTLRSMTSTDAPASLNAAMSFLSALAR